MKHEGKAPKNVSIEDSLGPVKEEQKTRLQKYSIINSQTSLNKWQSIQG